MRTSGLAYVKSTIGAAIVGPHAGHQIEHAGERGAGGQCALRRALDDGTVGERIGERHADLEHVCAGARRARSSTARECARSGSPAVT